MAYTYKQTFVDSSKYRIKCPYAMTPQYITVHNTANDASAANEVAYHNRNNNEVSFHVAIDDKEAIACIPFNRNAWHCGDANGTGNRKSIGIEICYSKSGGTRYTQAEENAVQYIAKLLKQYGWGVDRVKKHQDWSGKYCPHRILDEGRWDSFKKRIQTALDALKKPKVVKATSAPKTAVKANTAPTVRKEEETILLNDTGREEIRALLKKAREKGIIDVKKHTDAEIAKYNDIQLVSYQAAVVNRTYK